jgi:hypothetical protein
VPRGHVHNVWLFQSKCHFQQHALSPHVPLESLKQLVVESRAKAKHYHPIPATWLATLQAYFNAYQDAATGELVVASDAMLPQQDW